MLILDCVDRANGGGDAEALEILHHRTQDSLVRRGSQQEFEAHHLASLRVGQRAVEDRPTGLGQEFFRAAQVGAVLARAIGGGRDILCSENFFGDAAPVFLQNF